MTGAGETDADGTTHLADAVARDLRECAETIAAVHDWPVPTFEVSLGGDRPAVTVETPADASPTTARRLAHAACRDSEYAAVVCGLYDAEVSLG